MVRVRVQREGAALAISEMRWSAQAQAAKEAAAQREREDNERKCALSRRRHRRRLPRRCPWYAPARWHPQAEARAQAEGNQDRAETGELVEQGGASANLTLTLTLTVTVALTLTLALALPLPQTLTRRRQRQPSPQAVTKPSSARSARWRSVMRLPSQAHVRRRRWAAERSCARSGVQRSTYAASEP